MRAYRNGTPISHATLWNGSSLIHPEGEGGFVGTIIELWIDECYTHHGLYKPSKGDVVFDIGAHVGLFSIWAARKNPDSKVIALEATRVNYNCLSENVASMNLQNIQPYYMAIGKEAGVGKMQQCTDRSIDHRLTSADEDDEESVQIVPISELFSIAQTDRIHFLKMDVEGAERDAFETVDSEMMSRINYISMEYHDNLRPGTLDFLREKMQPTHDLIIEPTESREYGILTATIRDDQTGS